MTATAMLASALGIALALAAPQAPPVPAPAPPLASLFPDPGSVDSHLEDDGYAEYEGEALFDYIDGGAEVYLALGFVRVGARDYLADLGGGDEVGFTLDVYDMGSPAHALAIYGSETYGDPPLVDVGAAGRRGGGALFFWSRNYYVKVRADDEGEEIDRILEALARFVARKIGEPAAAIPELALFPESDRVRGSERYAARGWLGVESLAGLTCGFEREGMRISLGVARLAEASGAAGTEAARPVETVVEAVAARAGVTVEAIRAPAGATIRSDALGSGRILLAGRLLAVGTGLKGEAAKDAWALECMNRFFSKVREAATAEAAKAGAGAEGKE